MKNKNLWIASGIGAAVSLLASNLPFINLINCLLCAGFWGSAILAVWMYRRLNGSLTISEGVRVGIVSGLIAGIIGFLLSFIGLAGIQGLMSGSQQFLPADAMEGVQDIPAWGSIIINLIGVIIEIGMGALGGWIGSLFLRTDRQPAIPASQN